MSWAPSTAPGAARVPDTVAPAGGVAARTAAYRALRRVHSTGAWSSRAVDSALRSKGLQLDARDRSFAANLAYETLRWEGTLDWALARVLTRPLAAVQPELLDVLRMGAWQLLRSSTPPRAAVDSSVEVARTEVGPQATGFVNGVLRGLTRATLPWPPEDDDAGLGLALGYPAWVVGEAKAAFGDRARAVLEAGNVAPGVTLRVVVPPDVDEWGASGAQGALAGARHRLGVARDQLVAELRDVGVEARPGELAPEAVRAPGADPSRLAAVAEGRAVVQDEASMVVVRALEAVTGGLAGVHVVDLCAAPGGKSTHLAALGAAVTALDLHPGRARMVADAAARDLRGRSQMPSRTPRVRAVAADGRRPPLRAGAADAVLLDAPCTGLGVVRRRPELRWNRDPGDPVRLGDLQGELLESAARLVRPGGTLLYSVCTWTSAETTVVLDAFLAAEGDRFTAGAPVQLDPDRHAVDGMFLCALRRRD